MKNIIYIIISIAAFTFSCKSDFEKANESFAGSWKLESMQYEDSTGTIKYINNSKITLSFINNNKYGPSLGYEIIDNDTLDFEYSIDYEGFNVDIMLNEQSNIKRLPLDGIGKVQVYHYSKIDKKTIELYIDFEYDYANDQLLKNISYLYSKVD
jgi:hypothetical protein